MRDEISIALDTQDGEYDVDAIAAELTRRGYESADDVPPEEFWGIVAEHEKQPEPTWLDRLLPAAAAAPVGEPAAVSDGPVTITITGHSRVNLDRPGTGATVRIATPLEVVEIAADSNTTWESVAAEVSRLREEHGASLDRAMRAVEQTQRAVTQAEAKLATAIGARRDAIRALRELGVSAYRIAKITGLTEQRIGQILK